MSKEKVHDNIPVELFTFANTSDHISDAKFDTKPIGYFKDAMIRFTKNKGSVVSFFIIMIIVLFAIIVPFTTSETKATHLDAYYSKKTPRVTYSSGKVSSIIDGTTKDRYSDRMMVYNYALGVGAEVFNNKDKNGNYTTKKNNLTIADSMDSQYQPVKKYHGTSESTAGVQTVTSYNLSIDEYLSVGFIYKVIHKDEYDAIKAFEAENGIHVLYPMVEQNDYDYSYKRGQSKDAQDANYWYKTNPKNNRIEPITTKVVSEDEITEKKISITEENYQSIVLEDNYQRNDDGSYVMYEKSGALGEDYRVRVLYYNYYQFQNGFLPSYFFGTDTQGYDLAYRMASGIRLSLLLAVCVSVINFIIGAIYGAIEGYYGGSLDLILERIKDILSGIPFIVVATLFQMHLARKVGAFPSLIFAFVMTGWIGTSARVRTQFYRFKNQEYVMAARTLGARDRRIIWKHIFPNTLGTIVTSSVLVIPSVIFSESMLSYLGIVNLGGATTTSLGTLLSAASSSWTTAPHLLLFPATVISLLMICFNLFGNGLRDAFNPSLRGVEE